MVSEIFLDNIIYSLQRGGGASVVWTEHIRRLLGDNRFNAKFLEYEDAASNVFRKTVSIPSRQLDVKKDDFLFLERYLDINSHKKNPYIFHSSHYRIDNCNKAINVTTVHDFVYEYFVKGFRKYVHSQQKWNAIRRADKIICISESTKRDLLHFLPDIREDRIAIVYNGVDAQYHPLASAQEYKLELPFATKEYLVYVGNRSTPYKNFKLAVDVCRETKKPLVFVGGEPVSDKERMWLTEMLNGRFYSMRGISNSDLNELYNRSFGVIYPSLYEGFGIPVIEAQRAGAPVVCFCSSSIPEVAGDTDLCVSEFTKEAVIDRLIYLDNNDYRSLEIKKGLQNAKRFSWDKTYQQTTELYLSLWGNK